MNHLGYLDYKQLHLPFTFTHFLQTKLFKGFSKESHYHLTLLKNEDAFLATAHGVDHVDCICYSAHAPSQPVLQEHKEEHTQRRILDANDSAFLKLRGKYAHRSRPMFIILSHTKLLHLCQAQL